MSIKNKLNLIFLVLLGLVVTSSWVSFYAKNSFSDVIDFVTGPAWSAADGAMEASIEIEKQMLLVGKIINPATEEQTRSQRQSEMREAVKAADIALRRMKGANLVDTRKIRELDALLLDFESSREALLQSSSRFLSAQLLLDDSFEAYEKFFVDLEELGDSAVEALRDSPNRQISWNGGLKERWSLADGAMEANIALLTRIYFYERIIFEGAKSELTTRLEEALSDLHGLVEELTQIDQLKQSKPNGSNNNYADVLADHQKTHIQNFSNALDANKIFVQARSRYDQLANEVLSLVAEIEELGDSQVEGQEQVIEDTKSLVNVLVVLSFGAGLVVAFFARLIAVKEIATPLNELSQTLANNRGNLNLSLRTDYSGEIGHLSEEINTFNESIRETLSTLSEKVHWLNEASESLSDMSMRNAQAAESQKTEVYVAVTSLHQMSAAAEQITRSMEETNIMAMSLNQTISKGSQAIDESVSVSAENTVQLESASSAILRLQEQSQTIGSVLEVINNIAEQTNLLALNAAIEAARAGEQGRGFAVVADEVRNLAQKTQESTHSIHSTINQLQGIADEVVSVISVCVDNATSNSDKVAESGRVFDETLEAIQKLTDMSTDVVSAAEEQAMVLKEVNRNMDTINEGTKQGEALAIEGQALTEKLQKISEIQKQQISKFSF